MKRPITPAYTFTPGSSTLNLSGITSFDIRNLFAVIDLKTGALLYAPIAGLGYSVLSGTTLTLQASMAGQNGADPLLILYDDGGKPAEDSSVQAAVTALTTLNAAVASNHADLTAIHADTGTALHADLAAILAKQPGSPALDGADITGAAMPTGGAGIRGWLSALFALLKGGAPNAPRLSTAGALASNGATLSLAVDGMSTAAVKLAGTWSGTVAFLGSADGGATFDVPLGMIPFSGSLALGGGVAVSSTTVNGFWEIACGTLSHIQVAMSSYVSGSATALLVAANGLKSVRVGNPSGNPLTVTIGKAATTGDTAIATGGSAQALFAAVTPANGWKVANPDPAEDLWVSDSTTAAPNAQGSYRIPAGGIITTEPGERPAGPVSVYGATTGHVVTARSW